MAQIFLFFYTLTTMVCIYDPSQAYPVNKMLNLCCLLSLLCQQFLSEYVNNLFIAIPRHVGTVICSSPKSPIQTMYQQRRNEGTDQQSLLKKNVLNFDLSEPNVSR